MGAAGEATRQKTLGDDWTELEWGSFTSFSITLHTPDVLLRKRITLPILFWPMIPVGETDSGQISVGWYESMPYARVEARGRPGLTVTYVYANH